MKHNMLYIYILTAFTHSTGIAIVVGSLFFPDESHDCADLHGALEVSLPYADDPLICSSNDLIYDD